MKWISIDVFGYNYIINDVCICKLLQQCIYIFDADAVGVMIMGERGYFCNADDERHITLLFFVEYWPRGWGDLVFVVSLDLCPAAGQHNVSPYSLPDSPGIPNMSHKHIPEPLTSAATRRRHRCGPPPGRRRGTHHISVRQMVTYGLCRIKREQATTKKIWNLKAFKLNT